MKLRHWITAIVLLLLMALAIIGLVRTREQKPAAETDETGKAPSKRLQARGAAKRPLVDQRPLLTARRMAAMASTPEEQAIAHQPEQIVHHKLHIASSD